MAEPAEFAALSKRILAGDLRALARAATLIENQPAAAEALIKALFPHTGHAMTIGVTGAPGTGKSTLVDQLTSTLRKEGKTVGIVAVDPSSPFSRGAILGDRIRMQSHHDDPGVFIRSMANRGQLGGLARGSLEVVLLFDAAGLDVVLLETVGVGQDEIEVAGVADVTVVVLAPGLGDDVQAIKAGIMEIADVFAINKSDRPGAGRLEQEIRAMQSLSDEENLRNAAPVRRVVATEGKGVKDLLAAVRAVFGRRPSRNALTETWTHRLREMLVDRLTESLPSARLEEHAQKVAAKLEDPYTAVAALRSHLTGL
jgi:LAO/AO transport system kinase